MLLPHNRLFHRLVLALDLALIGLGLQLSMLLGSAVQTKPPSTQFWQTAIVFLAWFVVSSHIDLYRSRRTDKYAQEFGALLRATVMSLSFGCLASLTIWEGVFFGPLLAPVLILCLLSLQRYGIRSVLRRIRFGGRNYRRVAMVGSGPAASQILRSVDENGHYGIRLCGYVTFPEEAAYTDSDLRHLGDVGQLNEIVVAESVDLVLVCPPVDTRIGEMNRVFAMCDQAGVQCRCSLDFSLLHLHTTVSVFGGFPTISFSAHRPNRVRLAVKRLMDTVISGVALLLLIPFWVLAALLIKIWDGGPVLFKQVRIGEGGQLFLCYKFRTMCVDAEQKKAELLSHNEQDGPVFKMRDDPRVTPVGRFLRKYSLDELPQLLNVFKGDMSLVGPRPPTPDEVQQYEWGQRRRFSVPPGITCIWQVWGRNRVSFKRWLEMDLYYIDNWSLALDFKLLAHTLVTVVRGTGV